MIRDDDPAGAYFEHLRLEPGLDDILRREDSLFVKTCGSDEAGFDLEVLEVVLRDGSDEQLRVFSVASAEGMVYDADRHVPELPG